MSIMLCQHCSKDIPEENFQIHEVNCIKNNVKCEKCNEIVPKSSLGEHFESLHQLKKCVNCELEFEVRLLASHDCSDPNQACKYCEAVLKTSLFAEHLVGCENQTEECSECKKFIRKKDLESHKKSNCGLPQLNLPIAPALPAPYALNPNLLNFNNSELQIKAINANNFNFNNPETFSKLFDSNIWNQPPVSNLNNIPVINNPANNNPLIYYPMVYSPLINIPGINNPVNNVPVINNPVNNVPVINNPIIENSLDNLKNYKDDGGVNYKTGLSILKGPIFSICNRPMLTPTRRVLISTPEDYNEYYKSKK